MTPRQVRLVKEGSQVAASRRNQLAAIFFAQLFARDPSLRFLFKGDLRAHGVALHSGLAAIVASLDRPHTIQPALEWLAVRCAARGLAPRRYGPVGQALLTTVEAGLDEAFTDEQREAWAAAIRLVGGMMESALQAEPLAA